MPRTTIHSTPQRQRMQRQPEPSSPGTIRYFLRILSSSRHHLPPWALFFYCESNLGRDGCRELTLFHRGCQVQKSAAWLTALGWLGSAAEDTSACANNTGELPLSTTREDFLCAQWNRTGHWESSWGGNQRGREIKQERVVIVEEEEDKRQSGKDISPILHTPVRLYPHSPPDMSIFAWLRNLKALAASTGCRYASNFNTAPSQTTLRVGQSYRRAASIRREGSTWLRMAPGEWCETSLLGIE
ncbi:hypothetical protein B0T25DRAFT_99869 [Lasiosphaeria hispida]|uniref:Uncharacterized protein n=1 Tax=Lasiosphaeria hispida TaxID=260671 RepID=A0AAJ0HQP6_9PEZI|nr:hypothetical protein B0T25DRAFT_99869 [Lasiosphaeria hispida]